MSSSLLCFPLQILNSLELSSGEISMLIRSDSEIWWAKVNWELGVWEGLWPWEGLVKEDWEDGFREAFEKNFVSEFEFEKSFFEEVPFIFEGL